MPIRRSRFWAPLVALAVAACAAPASSPSAPTLVPPTAISTIPGRVPSLPPSPPPSPAATPASSDLAMYALPQANDLLRGAAVASIASGPAGVVVLANDRATGALISLTSRDGDRWDRHWLPGTTFGGGTPDRLVGGSFGYLAIGWKTDSAARGMVEGIQFPRALWSSIDGVTWSLASEVGLPAGEITWLASGPVGVAALVSTGADQRPVVALTRDGGRWQAATMPADAIPRQDGLAATPDGFLLLGSTDTLDPVGGTATTDAAWRSNDGLAWTSDPELAKQLHDRDNSIDSWQLSPWGAVGWSSYAAGSGVALLTAQGLQEIVAPGTGSWAGQVVAGPVGLVWTLGADRSASCVSAWRFVDDGWSPLAGTTPDMTCLNAAGPYLLGSAAVPGGMVVIGMLGAERDRVAWLIRGPGRPPTGTAAGGSIATPPDDAIPDPLAVTIDRPAACPALPTSMKAVLDVTPAVAVGCFGDATMTFRAWVRDPGEGYGGTCSAFTPTWIKECVLPDYLLTARATGPTTGETPTMHAMRSPGARGELRGYSRWVTIQGHYDDPVSPSCRASGVDGTIGLETELPRALVVSACRLVFVVTDIRTTH